MPGAIPEKSKRCPNTVTVLIPLCMIMVAVTIPIPNHTSYRKVYCTCQKDQTGNLSARNIRGEACCKMLRMFVVVKAVYFSTNGVIIHNAIKIMIITIYRPSLYKNCVILKCNL